MRHGSFQQVVEANSRYEYDVPNSAAAVVHCCWILWNPRSSQMSARYEYSYCTAMHGLAPPSWRRRCAIGRPPLLPRVRMVTQ
jgi:hypothetical protein